MANTPGQMFVKGIVAGWLIAVLDAAFGRKALKIFVITLITYLIALGGFTHVVAGSAEALYMWLAGQETFARVVFGFFLPTLAGNLAGGTLLFAVLSYAQVREEIEERMAALRECHSKTRRVSALAALSQRGVVLTISGNPANSPNRPMLYMALG